MFRTSIAMLMVVALTAPGLARSVPYCPQSGDGLVLEFSFGVGMPRGEAEENEVYMQNLRRMGVDATGVTQWNGCIRAFVRDADGHGEHMEFYDPRTYELIVLD